MATNIVVPHVGESIIEARIARWLKRAGDAVTAGEAIVELETDKIDVEVTAPQTGVLATIAQADGADVKVGDVIGTIAEGAAASAPASASTPAEAGPATAAPTTAAPTAAAPSSADPAPAETSAPAAGAPAPAPAPKTAAKPALKPQPTSKPASKPTAPPTSPASTPAAPAAPGPAAASTSEEPTERVRMSKRRATIARRLVDAQHTAAMLTTFNEVDMSAVMALRARQGKAFEEKHGVRLGITAFFVQAAVAALREFPNLNAEVQGDEIVLKRYYNIGVAVAAAGGLVVPVLRGADRMTFAEIERAIRAAKQKSDANTLTLDDLGGGTFTITNGGVFGSLMSTPILNAPEVAILGLHAIQQRPVGVDGQVVLRPMMYLALTYDHRIVDGAEAVQFLVRIQKLVADPAALLVEG